MSSPIDMPAVSIFRAFCLHAHSRIKPFPLPIYVAPPVAALIYAAPVIFFEKLIIGQVVERHEHASTCFSPRSDLDLPWTADMAENPRSEIASPVAMMRRNKASLHHSYVPPPKPANS